MWFTVKINMKSHIMTNTKKQEQETCMQVRKIINIICPHCYMSFYFKNVIKGILEGEFIPLFLFIIQQYQAGTKLSV